MCLTGYLLLFLSVLSTLSTVQATHTPTSSRSAPHSLGSSPQGYSPPKTDPGPSHHKFHIPTSSRSAPISKITYRSGSVQSESSLPESSQGYSRPGNSSGPATFLLPTSSRSAPLSKITYRSGSLQPESLIPESSQGYSRRENSPRPATFLIPSSSRSAPLSKITYLAGSLRKPLSPDLSPPNSILGADDYETFPSLPGSRYKLYTHLVPWAEALLYCQKDGEGSLLAVINSQEEADVVKEVFARVQNNSTQYLHVGINDIYQEGVWMTVMAGLDQPLSTAGYEVWQSGQPNNGIGENCGAVDRQARLNDVLCNMFGAPFLCEKPNV